MHKMKIYCTAAALLLAVLTALTFIAMPKEPSPFSENENRYLSRFPALNLRNITNKKFMTGFETWFSDRFYARENFIRLKNRTDIAMGKTEISDVVTARGRMMELWNDQPAKTEKNLGAIANFSRSHRDTPVHVLLAPNAVSIYADTLPIYEAVGNQREYITNCYNTLGKADTQIDTADVFDTLSNYKDDYIFYRTDHHWTSLGAYLAYRELAPHMGFTPLNITDYTVEHAASDFRGTLYSKTLDNRVTPDTIDFYIPSGFSATVKPFDKPEHDSLYFREFLGKKDKYSAFLGANAPVVDIETNVKNDKSLLIFKDSFSHSLVPFLCEHYNKITMLDMRYINTKYSDLVNVEEYNDVLFMYNVITFSDDGDLQKINMK